MAAALFASSLAVAAIDDELSTLGKRHGTDKVKHGFTKLYDARFSPLRSSVRHVLEVGVFFGSSLRMWQDFFPQAQIVGLDSFKGVQGYMCRPEDKWCNHGRTPGQRLTFDNPESFLQEWRSGHDASSALSRIQLVVGNQSDSADMERVVSELLPFSPFDIIIEDGSHLNGDQQRNLAQLLPLLSPGGTYVIEDVHSSLELGYDDPPGSADTTLRVVEHFNQTGVLHSRHLSRAESHSLQRSMRSVECVVLGLDRPMYKQSGACFITKKREKGGGGAAF